MKIYFVQYYVCGGNNICHIVKAKNKKEAIDKVWVTFYILENIKAKTNGFDAYIKKDLYVEEINNLFKYDDCYRIS